MPVSIIKFVFWIENEKRKLDMLATWQWLITQERTYSKFTWYPLSIWAIYVPQNFHRIQTILWVYTAPNHHNTRISSTSAFVSIDDTSCMTPSGLQKRWTWFPWSWFVIKKIGLIWSCTMSIYFSSNQHFYVYIDIMDPVLKNYLIYNL